MEAPFEQNSTKGVENSDLGEEFLIEGGKRSHPGTPQPRLQARYSRSAGGLLSSGTSFPGGGAVTSPLVHLEHKLHAGGDQGASPLTPVCRTVRGSAGTGHSAHGGRPSVTSRPLAGTRWAGAGLREGARPAPAGLAGLWFGPGSFLATLSLDVLHTVWKRHKEERFEDWTVLGLRDKETMGGRFLLVGDIACLIFASKPSIQFSPRCALWAHGTWWTLEIQLGLSCGFALFTAPNSAIP